MPRSIVVVLALGALLAGCGLPDLTPDPGTPPPSSAPAPPSTAGSPSSAGQTPAPTVGTPSAQPSAQVVATRTSTDEGVPLTIELYPLVRNGNLTELNLTLRADSEDKYQVADIFADNNYQSSDFSGHTVDGIQLVDGKNSKLYLVASDGKGNCLCSRGLASVFIADNEPVLLSATYAAPPPDVTEMSVRIPSFGVITNVPVG